MVFGSLTHILTLFLDIFAVLGITNGDKDLEIIILRQQVRILQRTVMSPSRISDPEKMVLATLTDKYRQSTAGVNQHLHKVMLIFKPDTILRWHRDLVRRKGTYPHKGGAEDHSLIRKQCG